MKKIQLNLTKALLTAVLFLPFYGMELQAQSDTSSVVEPPNKSSGGEQKFLLAGKAQTAWQNPLFQGTPYNGIPSVVNSFNPLAIMLMPLVKINNKLFLDCQVEVDPNGAPGGGSTISVIELILYYRLCTDMSLFFGNFSPKYGLYMGVLDDFTNRYGSSPIGMGHGPQTQTGVGIQGGLQTGCSKLNYQLYLSNGPQLIVDTGLVNSSNLNGTLAYGNYTATTGNKTIGGSLGFLPFSNSCLQVDVSGQYTPKVVDQGSPYFLQYANISSSSMAADLNYYHTFSPIMIRVLAEYNSTNTQSYNIYSDQAKTNIIMPAFNNMLSGWFAGATLRIIGADNIFLKNLELGGRIGAYTPPSDKNCLWGGPSIQQSTLCLTYWPTWKTPINLVYDVYTGTGNTTQNICTIKGTMFF